MLSLDSSGSPKLWLIDPFSFFLVDRMPTGELLPCKPSRIGNGILTLGTLAWTGRRRKGIASKHICLGYNSAQFLHII